ncbi:MAG: signal peptidase II [Burkholderiales bacterium]
MPNWTRWLGLSAMVILLDQLTKFWVTSRFQLGDSVAITSFFNMVLAYNTGAAFSFLADAGGWQRIFFTAIAVIAAIVIVVLLRKPQNHRLFNAALALILGGALGNLVDRMLLGHVVDFIQVHAADYYWPAFNIADSAITIGAALLIWDSFRKPAQPGLARRR